jgi:TonB family protein
MVPRSFIGLAPPPPRLPPRMEAVRAGGLVSVLLHVGTVAIVMLAAGRVASVATGPWAASAPPVSLPRMVFLQMPQPGGGGGGGGKREPLPPPRARDVGRDRVTLPVATPLIAAQPPADAPPPPEQAMLDTVPLASGTALLAGLPDALPSPALSGGPGVGGGIGTGTGTGLGSGTGPGLGPGSGGGFGGGAYRPGGAVVAPTLLRQVLPKYTPDALQKKIQGTVVLEVVVSRDGMPTAIRVVRSLDPGGLDQEAIAAVREWRFTPGRLGSTAVDVLVTIWVDFRVV